MLLGIRQFLHRNRRRLIFTTGIAAFIYLLYQYLLRKFNEYQQRLSDERFSREQIKRRFEQTQKDSLYTVYSLVPVLNNVVFDALAVEKITVALQARRLEKGRPPLNGSQIDEVSTTTGTNATEVNESTGDVSLSGEARKSKNELWNDLKIMSLTRLLTLVYSHSLLILITRLQLNILARREYLEDAIKLASSKHGFVKKENEEEKQKDEAGYVNEQAYLSLSWWLLNRGWIQIRDRVEGAVKETFKDITPRAELTLDDFALLLNKTQTLIESDTSLQTLNTFIQTTLLPPPNLQTFVLQQTLDLTSLNLIAKDSDSLNILIEETQNYVTSPSTSIVLNSLATQGISTALNSIAHFIHSKSSSPLAPIEASQISEISEKKVKLAVLLANVSKVANEFKTYPENVFINGMDCAEGLDELSASVYSNFEV